MRGYLAWDDAHLDDGLSVEFRYTQAYREYEGQGLARRELECLRIALPAAVQPVRDGDLLAGRRMFRPLGVAPSYWDDDTDGLDNVSFYADIGRMERVMNRPSQTVESRVQIAALIDFWKKENVNAKVRAKFDPVMRREMPSDLWNIDSGVIFGLYRLVFSQLDYDKLVRLGLPGLKKEVLARLEAREKPAAARTQVARAQVKKSYSQTPAPKDKAVPKRPPKASPAPAPKTKARPRPAKDEERQRFEVRV